MATVLEDLNAALHAAMAGEPSVYLIGEDVLDPYGGAFKVSRGLSSAFPDRVITTPVSEAGIVGLAAGMAMRGLRPVVEIMFGDFTTLIADQVINSITKFSFMFNEQVQVPMVIRTPMGGRRGYGATHSQTLEKLFLGVPGLRVLAPCAVAGAGPLLQHALLEDDGPVLFVENKLLYLVQLGSGLEDIEVVTVGEETPTYSLSVRGAPEPVLTLAAYGHMSELARQAVLELAFEHEIFIELVVPTQLAPFEIDPIVASARRSGRLLVAEEANLTLGWGAEVLARTAEALGPMLRMGRRLAAPDHPIPASGPLEAAALPDTEAIVAAAHKVLSAS